MAWLEPLGERMTPEQREVAGRIAAGPRGAVRGPLAVWLRRPVLADRAQALGEYCRYGSSLPAALSELAILVTARAWGSEYEWFAHKGHALAAGVASEVVEAIRTGAAVVVGDPAGQAVVDVAQAVNRDRRVDEALYARAVRVLGEGGMVDLVGVLGYYALISMTINVFEIERTGGGPAELTLI